MNSILNFIINIPSFAETGLLQARKAYAIAATGANMACSIAAILLGDNQISGSGEATQNQQPSISAYCESKAGQHLALIGGIALVSYVSSIIFQRCNKANPISRMRKECENILSKNEIQTAIRDAGVNANKVALGYITLKKNGILNNPEIRRIVQESGANAHAVSLGFVVLYKNDRENLNNPEILEIIRQAGADACSVAQGIVILKEGGIRIDQSNLQTILEAGNHAIAVAAGLDMLNIYGLLDNELYRRRVSQGEENARNIAVNIYFEHIANNHLPARLSIDFEDFPRDPIKPLLELFQFINSHNSFPRIRYLGSEGADQGGLTRDFVSKIFQNICHPNQQKWPMLVREERYLPKIEAGGPGTLSVKNQTNCCQAIGMIFARILNGDPSLGNGSVTTGSYFNPVLFSMLFALDANDLRNNRDQTMKEQLTKTYLKASYPNIFAPQDINEERANADIALLMKGTLSPRLNLLGIDINFLTSYQVNSIVDATLEIAKSMHNHLNDPSLWRELIGDSSQALRETIEGSLDRNLVFDAFNFNQNPNQNLGDFRDWLQTWIMESEPAQLQKFVCALTGSNSLSKQDRLSIYWVDRADPETLPVFHTCSKRIDLPRYESYEKFKQKLEQSFEWIAANGGFQLA